MDEELARSSRLERGSHIAQIVSAVAVVISIIYLAQQIRENTNAIGFETNRGILELQFQNDAWEQDPQHVEMMIRGDSLPTALSSIEWAQYSRRWALRYNVWWLAFHGSEQGTLDSELWTGVDRSYSRSICNRGTRRFWEERGYWWDDAFREHVERHAASC